VEVVTTLFAAALLTWLGLLAMLVTLRILRGEIPATGLLTHQLNADGEKVAPERVVAMTTVPAVLGLCISDTLQTDVSGGAGMPSLPDVPEYLLTVLTGGNGLYLPGKIARMA